MNSSDIQMETKLIHAGEPRPRIEGAVSMPIFQSANYEYAGEKNYHDIKYIRLNNTPNHAVLHQKLALLENAEAALVTSSGMAAITTSLFTVLSSGDHILAQNSLYGGTHDFITKDLHKHNISYDFIDAEDPLSWPNKLRPNTKAIYVEAMTNPLLQVAELKAIVEFARGHGLVSLIDNTFATPINFRPAEWHFDLSLHSCTKYLNGHSDIVAGAVIGKAELIERITHTLDHFGGSLDPHACFLLHRGIKTLALRVGQQNSNAMALATFLVTHPEVKKVNYPGLETHLRYLRARKLFDGFGGMLSFELNSGSSGAEYFVENVELPINAPSLGGLETLVTLPSQTSHSGLTALARRDLGISDGLIRVSVGIESIDDIISDFDRVLRSIPQ